MFVFLLAVCACIPAYTQNSALTVREMISKIATSKDLRFDNLVSVTTAFSQLDSVRRCEVFRELERKGPKRKYYRVRLKLVQSTLVTDELLCPEWPTKDIVVKEALRMAYEIDDTVLIAEGNRHLVNYYQRQGDFGTAGMYGLIAREYQDHAGPEHFAYLAYSHYDLGYVLYHSREYASCIDVTRDAIFWNKRPGAAPGDSMGLHYQMIAWNTIGLSHEKLQQYDSAFYAFARAKALSESMQNDFWTALITGNEGSVHFKMGQLDSAEKRLQFDYQASKEMNQLDNAGNSLLILAQIEALRGNATEALRKMREARVYLENHAGRETRANLYYAYSRAFKALGNADSLDHYMQKYLELHTAVEKDAEHLRADIVKLKIDNQESVHRIIFLNAQKERIILIRNFSIALFVIITALGLLYFNRQKLRMQLRQSEALEAKAKAEAEARAAADQLSVFTGKFLEKTKLVEQLQEQLLQRELTEEQTQHISALSKHTILTDDDWEQFKSLFEKVYPGFFVKLRSQVPDITVAEQRTAALSKLRITAKEAAQLLGISPNSVVKAKSRLRQRLNLDPEADLEKHFAEEEG